MHFYIRAVQIITSADEILSQALKKKKKKHSNFKHLGSYTRKQKVDLSLYLAAFSLISDAFPNLAQNFLFLLALGKSSKIAWHSLFEKNNKHNFLTMV